MSSLFLAAMLTASPAINDNPTETAVRAVLDDQVACWNRGDLDGFMRAYWNDERLTFFSGGTVTKGWKPVADRYRKRYKAEGTEMGTLTFADVEIFPIDASHSFARGKFKLVTSKGTEEGLYTLQLKKGEDGWKIVHDHTSK
jgi:ketosteroid isomerase-like protein